ncbi:MAG: hypothetical protein ACI9B8_000284 [Sulfitobacter sp.]|jgi:hypothetical protein
MTGQWFSQSDCRDSLLVPLVSYLLPSRNAGMISRWSTLKPPQQTQEWYLPDGIDSENSARTEREISRHQQVDRFWIKAKCYIGLTCQTA